MEVKRTIQGFFLLLFQLQGYSIHYSNKLNQKSLQKPITSMIRIDFFFFLFVVVIVDDDDYRIFPDPIHVGVWGAGIIISFFIFFP